MSAVTWTNRIYLNIMSTHKESARAALANSLFNAQRRLSLQMQDAKPSMAWKKFQSKNESCVEQQVTELGRH